MEQLKEMRMQVDAIDAQIVALFEKRMGLSEQISREKILNGDRIYNREREEKKVSELMEGASSEQNRHFVRDMYAQILSLERKRQYQLAQEAGATGKLPFIQVDSLCGDERPRVVFQGTEGAYSHAAMCRFFGEDVNGFHVRKFRDAMEAIADGAADFAVLPIENSTAGIVADNFDLLVDFENYIVGQQVIKCEHVLMGLPGTTLEEIDTVYSHQQALSQCEQFLESHPGWSAVPYDNTALAARKVAREGIRSHAAIGSAFAAKRFGLEILAEHGVSVVTNPASNMKLGNGFAPVPEMLAAGVNVCLGTDGAASNNAQNMFREMGYLSMIHKGTHKTPQCVGAKEVFLAATANGAKALGLDTGSIEEGKKADLAILRLDVPSMMPNNNLLAALCYSAGGSETDTVIIDGQIVMQGRELKTIDEERVYHEIRSMCGRLGLN